MAALCPAKIVQTGFVDRIEAESMLALKKVKNCLSTCDNSKASTGRLSFKKSADSIDSFNCEFVDL